MPDMFGYTDIPTTLYVHGVADAQVATIVWDGSAQWVEGSAWVLEDIHGQPRLNKVGVGTAYGTWSANDGITAAYDSFVIDGTTFTVWQVVGGLPDAVGTTTNPASGWWMHLLCSWSWLELIRNLGYSPHWRFVAGQ